MTRRWYERVMVASACSTRARFWPSTTDTTKARASFATCPKQLLIEARRGSKPLAFAGKLQPRRLIR
jgi:hypothetical protein